uniref:hypothetical protein n=1 Tax=Parerythrobacter lutipelagi TaxID=1964208 RepID=UPI0010F9FF54|nr:hypothetical protein [Parerythrobacter lutipelagi]
MSFANVAAHGFEIVEAPPSVCLDEVSSIKGKLETLLSSASARNFAEFEKANGENRLKAPRFVSLDHGYLTFEQAYAQWADLANPQPQSAVLTNWRPVLDQGRESDRDVRIFLATIENSRWDVRTSISTRVKRDYFVQSYGCDLFLIQETDLAFSVAGR